MRSATALAWAYHALLRTGADGDAALPLVLDVRAHIIMSKGRPLALAAGAKAAAGVSPRQAAARPRLPADCILALLHAHCQRCEALGAVSRRLAARVAGSERVVVQVYSQRAAVAGQPLDAVIRRQLPWRRPRVRAAVLLT